MALEWIGDDETGWNAVASDPRGGYSIYSADPDGTLRVCGTHWKECPQPMRPCPRPGSDAVPVSQIGTHPKCRRCSYSGRSGPHGDAAGARRIAELLQEQLEG